MALIDRARAEAHRRWPITDRHSRGDHWELQQAFLAGVNWSSEQLPAPGSAEVDLEDR